MPPSILDGYLGCFQFSAVKHSVFVLLKIFSYFFFLWYTNAQICLRYIPRTIIAGYRVYLFSTFPEKAKLLSRVTVTLFSWPYWWVIFFLRFVHFTYNVKYSGHESFHHALSDVCSLHSDPSPFYWGYCASVRPGIILGQWPQGKVASASLSSLRSRISSQCALVVSYHLVSSLLLWRGSLYIFIERLYFLGGRAGPLLLGVTRDSSLCLVSSVQQAHQGEVPSALLLKQPPAPPSALQLSACNATFHKCRPDPVWRSWLKTRHAHSWALCFPAGLTLLRYNTPNDQGPRSQTLKDGPVSEFTESFKYPIHRKPETY